MRRPAVGLGFPCLLAPLLAALVGAGPLCAQAVVGRIIDADAGGGVAGAFVVLADSAGRRRAAVLSDGQGRFVLTAPGPGTYTVRAERIGMATRSLPAFTLAAGERRSVSLALAPEAVPLAAIEVSAKKGRCELRPEAGAATARVWEEVRKALRVSAWARTSVRLEYTLRGHERVLDYPSHVVRSDSVWEKSGTGERPVISAPAEELAREGYVRGDLYSGFSFFGPDEDVLASDAFLDTHCLELRPRSAAQAGALAIDFRKAKRGGPVDIDGTAWLDARSGELRSIDFAYVGLGFNAPEAGGTVSYRRLPSGAWIVERFRLTFPLLRLVTRGAAVVSSLHVDPSQQVETYALHETTSEVLELHVAGGTRPLVRADSGRSGALTGEVYDSIHARALAGARVYLSGTVYAATADADGRFRIAGVPAGRYGVAFDHPVMDSLPARPAPVEATVPAGGEAALTLAVPGAGELRRRACPGDRVVVRHPVVFGRVRDAQGSVTVRVIWQEIEGQVPRLAIRQQAMDVPVDDAGRFVVCAPLPEQRPATLRAVRQASDGRRLYGVPVEVIPERDGLHRVDLVAPKP